MSVNDNTMHASFSDPLPCATCVHVLDPVGGFSRAKSCLCEVYGDLENPKPRGVLFDNEPCDNYEPDEQLASDSVEEEDGGSGSGNWGHKGRPGYVGGSGKGGGNQYRGGRGDIMYTSSRHDWLNGLKGERQHEAHTFMKNMREGYGAKEGENLEKIIMGEGLTQHKTKLLEYMAEARGWDKHAQRLTDENWDDTDRKLAEALAKKYGIDKTRSGKTLLPDEAAMEKAWEDPDFKENKRCWLDLKSKAMGGPTSGEEPPDELQYAAGLKERPAPPPAPKWPEPYMNNQWFNDLPDADKQKLDNILMRMSIYNRLYSGGTIDSAERAILDRISKGNEEANIDGMVYFKTKDDITGGMFMRAVEAAANPDNPVKIGNLEDKESIILSAFMEDLLKEDNAKTHDNKTLSEIGNDLEVDFMADLTVPKSVKAAYLTLKAAAMGTSLMKSEIANATKAIQEYRIERADQRKAAEALKTKEGREAAYNPPSVAGVARRSQGNMSFDEADNNHANPDYKTNRNYRINCQTCVVAHEMRLRGYDVEAKPRHGDAEEMQYKVARTHGTSAVWLDMDTGKPVAAQTADKNGAKTRQGAIKWLERAVKPGERYHMSFCWKNTQSAHIVTLQRDDSGSLMIYDPQTNEVDKDLNEYLSNVTFTATAWGRWPMQIVRVDNAIPVQSVVNTILKPARQY